MEKQSVKKLCIDYFPPFCVLVSMVVTLILFAERMPAEMDRTQSVQHATVFFDIVFVAAVAFALVFLNRRFRLGIPHFLVWLVCVHLVLSVHFGTALGWYYKFPWWDDFLHGSFGVIGCAGIYYLFLRRRKNKLDAIDHIVIVLLVVAFAALWEIFEFVAGEILNADTQDADMLVSAGKSAVLDTMMDLIDAIVGALLYEICLQSAHFIARRRRRKQAQVLPGEPLSGLVSEEGEVISGSVSEEGETLSSSAPEKATPYAEREAPKQKRNQSA